LLPEVGIEGRNRSFDMRKTRSGIYSIDGSDALRHILRGGYIWERNCVLLV
jgi:hypothetical protein